MATERDTIITGPTGTGGAGLHRADQPVMTISRDAFEFSQFIAANSDLLVGMQPAVINPHEELVIKMPKDIETVADAISRFATITLPEGMQLSFGVPYETIDFITEFDNFDTRYSARLRLARQNGIFRDMRYLFAKNTRETVTWDADLQARVENIIAIMRKYSDHIEGGQKEFDYATVLRFFNEHSAITQIIHKVNCDVSFGSEFDRTYADAGYRDEKGEKVPITDTHRISSVNHFIKAVISRSHRAVLTPALSHEYGIGTAISLLKGNITPSEVIEAYNPTSSPSIGIDIELRGNESYRKLASSIAMQVIQVTNSTEYGALARKGSVTN